MAKEIEVSPEVQELYESAQRFLEVDNYQCAAERLERVVVLSPEHALFWVKLGTCYREEKRTAESEFSYARARILDPDDFDAAFHMGVLKADCRSWADAELHLQDAVKINPRDTHALYNLAGIEFHLRKRESLKSLVEQIRELDPTMAGNLPQPWFLFVRGSR